MWAMKGGDPRSFGAQLKALREAAGFTQGELATIAGLSVHAVSALERGERRRPHLETMHALAAAAVLKGEDAWAARILGARDTVLERGGVALVETRVDDLRNHAEATARERLGPDRWARAYDAGRKTPIESAQDLSRFVSEGHR